MIHSPVAVFTKFQWQIAVILQKRNEKESQDLDELLLVHKKNKAPIACALFTFKNPQILNQKKMTVVSFVSASPVIRSANCLPDWPGRLLWPGSLL